MPVAEVVLAAVSGLYSINTFMECIHCKRTINNKGSLRAHENSCALNEHRPDQTTSLKRGRRKGHRGSNQFTKARRLGLPDPISPVKGRVGSIGRKHSDATKAKLSSIRKKYLEEHPEKSPWVYSHYTKGRSYPERYWRRVLYRSKVPFVEQHRVSRFCLDFAVLGAMIDIEIDGEQHYSNDKAIARDATRTEHLLNLGWETIRIRWSVFKKMSKPQRKEFIQSIILHIKDKLDGEQVH